MAGDIITAAFGLGGVALGGVINYAASTQTERRHERGALLVAARLVHAELNVADSLLNSTLNDSSWELLKLTPISVNAWGAHQQTLANKLTEPDWRWVSLTFVQLDVFNALAKRQDPDDLEIDPDIEEQIPGVREQCNVGMQRLESYIDTPFD